MLGKVLLVMPEVVQRGETIGIEQSEGCGFEIPQCMRMGLSYAESAGRVGLKESSFLQSYWEKFPRIWLCQS